MKDQVAALAQIGLSAAFINSTLSQDQCQEIFHRARHGIYKLIYVAPERLSAPSFLHLAQELEIPLVAIDEAHCVSQWGQDFRPSYLKITEFVKSFPQRPAVGAFTATATEQVKEDIKRLLALQNPLCITTGFDRPNLYFETIRPKSKDAYLKKFISEHPGQSGIVYCSTRKTVESVCAVLAERRRRERQRTEHHLPPNAAVRRYHQRGGGDYDSSAPGQLQRPAGRHRRPARYPLLVGENRQMALYLRQRPNE